MNSKILFGAGALIVIISAFLPWASVMEITVSGFRGQFGGKPGLFTIVLAVLAGGMGFIGKKWSQILAIVFAVLIIALMALMYSKDSECAGEICPSIGIGHYLTYVGALALIAGGVMGMKEAGQKA